MHTPWWLLGGGLVGVVALVVSGDEVPAEKRSPRREPLEARTREAPDEAKVAARRRRAMDRLIGRREPMRAVKVRVTDCRHVVAAHAEVEVLAGDAYVSGLADDQGMFRAEVPESAEQVRVIARSGLAGEHRGEVAVTGAGAIEVGVCPGATVVGVVKDEAGMPLAGALVKLGEDFTETEEDGEFVLTDVWLEAWALQVDHVIGAVERAIEPLAAGEERRIEVVLEQGRRVAGVVVDWQGAPVPNAPVAAIDAEGHVLLRTTSDRNGRFWLKRLPVVPLRVRAEGGAAGIAEVALAATGGVASLVLRLAPQGVLVVYWEGEPGARLSALPSYAPWESPADDVEARVVDLSSGQEMLVAAPRYWRVTYERGDGRSGCGEGLLSAGGRLEVRCGAIRTALITAQVVSEDGRPVVGRYEIYVGFGNGASVNGELDSNGRFLRELKLAESGPARLMVEAPGHATLERRAILLAPGQRTDLGRLQMVSQATLAARFPDGDTPFGGIGARVQSTDFGIALTSLARGGPLDAAGIVAGDVIVGVDGVPAGTLTTFEAIKLMRGTPGTELHLQLMRGPANLFDVRIQRALVDVPNVDWVD